ncbi:homoserine dehydrogenase [Candidatus Carsonella ruddii]|uniref:homoserine dehydrogenase n=1 Tax=Candidatus Carsonella ruddii PC isolate NHV TaxID=1202540 RepID=J3YQT6_CARRU|nr:homoserine dehydrogenase [Candidatus Carsonella ruddii]AFP84348.1 homoserine dehydrogenase [Candidatus Carsonella ruddii PC isolate NHV]
MKISIFGLGVVGSSFYNIFKNKSKIITFTRKNKFNCKLNKTFNKYKKLFNKNSIFVELIGSINCIIEIVLNSIKNKNNYITANKEFISKYSFFTNFMFKISNIKIYYEASVGGSLPLIKLTNYYSNSKILYCISILNGTTNFILTNLTNLNFKKLINLSIKKGYAEYNYSNDIFGLDTLYKHSILCSLFFKKFICHYKFNLESIFGTNNFLKKNFYIKKYLSIFLNINNYLFSIISVFLTKNIFLYKTKNSLNLSFLNFCNFKKHILIAPGAGAIETGETINSNFLNVFEKKYFKNYKCNNFIYFLKHIYFCFNLVIYLKINYNYLYIINILKIKIIKFYKHNKIFLKTKKNFYKKILFFLYYIKNNNFYISKFI